MSDTTLLRIAIAIAGVILIGAIVFFGRPRKQGQGKRIPRESIADAFAPRAEPTLGDAVVADGIDDNYDERATQAELSLDAEHAARIENRQGFLIRFVCFRSFRPTH